MVHINLQHREEYYPVEILGPQQDSDMILIGLVYKRNEVGLFITLTVVKKVFPQKGV